VRERDIVTRDVVFASVLDPAAAASLGPVERRVGGLDRRAAVQRRRRDVAGHADADADPRRSGRRPVLDLGVDDALPAALGK
jgi:hypothetical protein